MDLRSLKSGSDIRGTAVETAMEKVNLTVNAVKALGAAFPVFLSKKTGKKELSIAVGHDSRETCEVFRDALVEVLKKSGVTIFDCGLSSTPAMYEMIKHPGVDADGSIMITASHHPAHKNGLKFFSKDGGLTAADIVSLIGLAESGACLDGDKTMLYRKDFLKFYTDKLVALVRKKTGEEFPLEGLKIALDAGNGAGGFFAKSVLGPLGADTSASQFLEPDGSFPNHIPNPEDASAMRSISNRVRDTGADLGILFDTDVDRVAFVDKNGDEINRNKLIALVSAILLEESPGAYIVTDSVTSDGLKRFITEKGGHHFRYMRGYQNVIGQAKKLCAEGTPALLAMETSGHAALKENDFLDDGAYLAVRVLIKAAQLRKEGKELSSLIDRLESPASRFETRIFFRDVADFKTYGDTIVNDFTEFSRKTFTLEPSSYEGVRANVDYADGWFLLRQSVHDPNMVLNIESALPGGSKQIAKMVYAYLSGFKGLDCPGLKAYIES